MALDDDISKFLVIILLETFLNYALFAHAVFTKW